MQLGRGGGGGRGAGDAPLPVLDLHAPLSEAHFAALPCAAWAAVLGCPRGL